MKKILFISNEGSFTGAPLFLARLLRHLKEHRPEYELAVFFAKSGELADVLSEEGFNVFLSNKRDASRTFAGAIWCRIAHYFRYLVILCKNRPALVYSNTIVNSGEVVLARMLGTSVILHMHEGETFARAYRIRLVISSFFASRVIVGSEYVNRVLFNITNRQGIVIYNGINTEKFPLGILRTKDECLTLGMLGTIDPNKGQLIAIKAAHLLIQEGVRLKLKIAGAVSNGVYEQQLHTYLNQNLLHNYIEFIGCIQDSDEYLKSLDILLVPSFDEALPTVILEALAIGTIVVASNVGGIPEIIRHNINGLLATVGDEAELAKLIRDVSENTKMACDFREVNVDVLKNKFDIKQSNQQLTSELDTLINN
jgi:glycosyltransferase involved in cell wall biosynthesis